MSEGGIIPLGSIWSSSLHVPACVRGVCVPWVHVCVCVCVRLHGCISQDFSLIETQSLLVQVLFRTFSF